MTVSLPKTTLEGHVFFELTDEQADEIVRCGSLEEKFPFQEIEKEGYSRGKNTHWLYEPSDAQPEKFENANELLTGKT